MRIVVVGAGAAGLSAAYLLQLYGLEPLVLEAAPTWGGRVRSLSDFAPFSIELGAEEIHGNQSILFEMATRLGKSTYLPEGEDYYFFNGQLSSEALIAEQEGFRAIAHFWEVIHQYQGDDISLEELAHQQGISTRWFPILNAWFGNAYGSQLAHISIHSLQHYDKAWRAGNRNYLIKNSPYTAILGEMFADVLPLVRCQTPVKHIDYQTPVVQLTTSEGEIIPADRVIVTVPLPVLQQNLLTFEPALPPAKQVAIESLRMDAGMKLILRFKQPFWPTDMLSLYTDGYVPEYWTTATGKSETAYLLTAFITGAKAAYLAQQGEQQALQLVLQELDYAFGNQTATQAFEAHYWFDWAAEPFIRGSYSSPSLDSHLFRPQLALPVENRLFFAGEATHSAHFATVHGAMESANLAVEALLNTLPEGTYKKPD